MRIVCVSAYLCGLVYGSFSFVFLIVLFLLNVFVPSYVCTNRMRNIYVHAMLNIMTPFKSQRLDVRTKQIKSKKKNRETNTSIWVSVCVSVFVQLLFSDLTRIIPLCRFSMYYILICVYIITVVYGFVFSFTEYGVHFIYEISH